jgi:hypothetical protein
MKLRKIGTAAAGVCLGMSILPALSLARPVGTVQDMPFFGLPYPNYYVYHPPRGEECYVLKQVYDPLYGPQTVPVWICDEPVSARY